MTQSGALKYRNRSNGQKSKTGVHTKNSQKRRGRGKRRTRMRRKRESVDVCNLVTCLR